VTAVCCWVLIDETAGAKCTNGETLSAESLAHIAEAVQDQLNGEASDEWGGKTGVRVGSGPTDIQPGERVYSFVATLPNAPGASAYHDINGQGVPVAFCAVTTCDSVLGTANAVSVDVSHEMLEVLGDEGCNQYADDGAGTMHAHELCDPVEMQTYTKACSDGTVVYLSNFVLRSWFISGAAGPYEYMTQAGLSGAVPPGGAMQTAVGNGGNYQIECPSTSSQATQVTAAHVAPGMRLVGTRRKGSPHWSSRAHRRLHGS
jgi:hypothetical protein